MNPNYAESSRSRSEYGETRPLNLDRKVFLSHSGKDKNFVRFLHDKLCHRYHDGRFVFFDEESLPKAECVSMENILLEARGCELGVLVLSEDFFTHTPNPMLELETLTASGVQLLPLFYKMSVNVFNKRRRQNTWEERWKKCWGVGDERIQVWRRALSFVNRHSGLEYCKLATNELVYIEEIVKVVTGIIPPAISYGDEGVYGMDRLCKIVDSMYKECASKRSSDGRTLVANTCGSVGQAEDGASDALDLVGIYGFAGLGKTMLCRSLCDFYFAEFHGKVCWIDLGSLPSDEASSQTRSAGAFAARVHHLLSKLVGPIDGLHSLTLPEVKNLLGKQIYHRREPLFLAIDNILRDGESLDEVHFYLSLKFPKGSKIFITSRNEGILEVVVKGYTRFSMVIEHIPELKLEEARCIFVHNNPTLQIANMEDEVEACVSMCIIDESGKCYHPLMLKSLAALIRDDGSRNVDLKRRLRELQSAARLGVFKLLDITYEVLSKDAQKVFMDLALLQRTCSKGNSWGRSCSSYARIQSHSHFDKEKLDKVLLSLEDKAFICWKYGSAIQMHNVMVDFSKSKLSEDAVAAFADPVAVLSRYIAIKGDNGKYLALKSDGLLTFDAAKMTHLAAHEVFCNEDGPNATFIIRSQNMRFWQRDSANWIRANREADQPPSLGDTAARFTLARMASGKLAFRSAVDGLYLNRYNGDLKGYNACEQSPNQWTEVEVSHASKYAVSRPRYIFLKGDNDRYMHSHHERSINWLKFPGNDPGNLHICNCPNAAASNTSDTTTHLTVGEAANGRQVFDVKYLLNLASTSDQMPLVVGYGSSINNSSYMSNLMVWVSISQSVSKSHTFSNSFNFSQTVSTEFKAGIPFCGAGTISVQIGLEQSFSNEWGQSTQQAIEFETQHLVKDVPPGGRASVTIICSTAKMRIPFTYKFKDIAADGTERPSQEFVDGIFEGVDAYKIEAVISNSVRSSVVPLQNLALTPSTTTLM